MVMKNHTYGTHITHNAISYDDIILIDQLEISDTAPSTMGVMKEIIKSSGKDEFNGTIVIKDFVLCYNVITNTSLVDFLRNNRVVIRNAEVVDGYDVSKGSNNEVLELLLTKVDSIKLGRLISSSNLIPYTEEDLDKVLPNKGQLLIDITQNENTLFSIGIDLTNVPYLQRAHFVGNVDNLLPELVIDPFTNRNVVTSFRHPRYDLLVATNAFLLYTHTNGNFYEVMELLYKLPLDKKADKYKRQYLTFTNMSLLGNKSVHELEYSLADKHNSTVILLHRLRIKD